MNSVLGIFALGLLLLFGPVAYAHEHPAHKPMHGPANTVHASYDIQFLDTMAEHHREGIEMFRLALTNTQSHQVKNIAQRMIEAQEKEIPQLKAMRDSIQPDESGAINLKMPGMKQMNLAKLEALSGSAFDKAFLDMTIEHHQGALDMSRAEKKSGTSEKVKDKAQQIIDGQGREITELRKIRDSMT